MGHRISESNLNPSVFTVVGVSAGGWCPRVKTQVQAQQAWQAAQKVDAWLQSRAQRVGEVGWLQAAVVYPGVAACAHAHKDRGLSADERMPLLDEQGLLRPYTVVVFDNFSKGVKSLEIWAPSAAHAERAQATAFCLVAGVVLDTPSPAYFYQPGCRGPWANVEQRAWSLAMSYGNHYWQAYREQCLRKLSPKDSLLTNPAQALPSPTRHHTAPAGLSFDPRLPRSDFQVRDGPETGEAPK